MKVLFGVAFALLAAVICGGAVPTTWYFPNHAFGDQGWAITVDRLLADGLVPTRDFAYTYGLLPLSIHRLLYAAVGHSPFVVSGLLIGFMAAAAVGVWRIAEAVKPGAVGRLLILLTLPLVVIPSLLPSPVHAMESAILIHALAEQARGRLGRALLLATVGVLVKPALGYVFGFILLAQCLLTPTADGSGRWRRLVPAAVAGGGILALMAAEYGVEPVLKTQLPGEAQKEYRDLDCGFFFGVGRTFAVPREGTDLWLYYSRTPAGVWLLSSVALVLAAIPAAFRLRTDPAARLVATVAAWHVLFVCYGFSSEGSWIYYPYLPFVGGAVAVGRLPVWLGRPVGWPLAALVGGAVAVPAVLTAVFWVGTGARASWTNFERSPVTAGMNAPPALVPVWADVRAKAATGKVFVLCRMGCAPTLAPGVTGPRSWYLSRAIATPGEMDWTRDEIARSEWLLLPHWCENLVTWPELADVVSDFQFDPPYHHGDTFRLFARKPGRPAKP